MEVTYMSKNSTTVSFVAEVAGDVNRLMHSHEEGNMLILPLRDSILFPGTVNPITIGRKSSLKAVKHAERGERILGVFCQKDPEVEDPSYEDMIHIGVAAKVIHTIELPDGTTNVLLQTMNSIALQSLTLGRHGYEGDVTAITDIEPTEEERTEYETMLALIKERVVEFARLT
ncbi:MAG: LON peptidase substrate-binding domain-containing protein, partial [Bacteroidaceae bacterium]|nr:LON peptidase substrate-binding domain-containing protein [Bacteroidaceae bacterium]